MGTSTATGDLDLVFGKTIVSKLVQKGLANRHRHSPEVGIAYSILIQNRVSFACSLPRFAYLLRFRKAPINNPAAQQLFEQKLTKLPGVLATLSLEEHPYKRWYSIRSPSGS